MIYARAPSQRPAKNRVAVVGAGLSGLRVAVDLATRLPATTVMLVDAGPFSRRRHEGLDRDAYPGDGRQRSWPSTGAHWSDAGGLKLRVGGRSLCWHGQLLPIEDYALADWPEIWRGRLAERSAAILAELAPPRDGPGPLSQDWLRAGLSPVAQAGHLIVDADGLVAAWSAYSPLDAALGLRNLTILHDDAVVSVESSCGLVRVLRTSGDPIEVDFCVLSAGAIGNVALLAQSLGEGLSVPLCDHLCAGAVMAFDSQTPVAAPIRGDASLLGYRADDRLRANSFYQELAPQPDRTRTIDCWVLVEQLPLDASILSCRPTAQGAAAVAIEGRVTDSDIERTAAALAAADDFLHRTIAPVRDIVAMPDEAAAIAYARDRKGIVAHYPRAIGMIDHEACSHAIGTMCDDDLAVPGLPGVYLNGPGVFPRAGAANPGLSILAVASWLADSLADRIG